MYCGQCGTQNNEEAGHCETCGAPLLISAGARSCATCGSTLGDHDRFCPTCGASTEDASTVQGYDASDDFGELDVGDIEISDLPDWLREMAPQSESNGSAQPEQAAAESPEQASTDDMPDWLRDSGLGDVAGADTSSTHGPAEASGVNHQPADEFSLVSDEDLPEWLRALGDEEPEPVASQPQAAAQAHSQAQPQAQQTSAVATLFDVPPINRAWMAYGRQVDESQKSTAQQEFSPLEIMSGSAASAQASQTQVWDAESQPTEQIDAVDREQESESGDGLLSSRTRQIVAVGILVVLVLITFVLAFVLMQGLV